MFVVVPFLMLLDFTDDHLLVFADLEFWEAVGWTFESHSGRSHSWIDHVLISSSIANAVTEVYTLDCVSNFQTVDLQGVMCIWVDWLLQLRCHQSVGL